MDYYTRSGRKLDDLEAWIMQTPKDRKRVAVDNIPGGVVSTIFLGVNHNWNPDGPPILFETMIFLRKRVPRDGVLHRQWYRPIVLDQLHTRYGTEAEARAEYNAIRKLARRICQKANGPRALKVKVRR